MDELEDGPKLTVALEGVDTDSLTVEDLERALSAKLGTTVLIDGEGFIWLHEGDEEVVRYRLVLE
jgi:hypothetical protein